jgi:tetratricopeptide (TPR) repeat protein
MKRIGIMAVVVGGLAVGTLWNTSRTFAEPITAGDVAKQAEVPKSDVDAAETRFKNRDFDGALKLLQDACKKNPDLAPANFIMAQWFIKYNVAAGVRPALERAVVEAPDDPGAYIFMGEIALQDRRFAEAELLYQKADGLMAKWKGGDSRRRQMLPGIYSGLAATAANRGRWADAQKHLEASLKVNPKNAAALQQLSQCLFQQKNPDVALAKLKEAAKIDENMLLPETILAQYYMQSGDQEHAQENAGKWLVAALTVAPKDVKTRLIAAQWAWENGRLQESGKQADIALKLEPTSLNAKILRGIIALFQKDYKTAEVHFDSALYQSPGNFAASNNLALALVEQKDDAKKRRALELAEGNVQKYSKANDSRGPESVSTYGWVLYRLGRHDDAEKWLRAAVSNQGFSADTAYYLARVLVDQGQEANAQKLLEGALGTKPPFAWRAEAQSLLDSLKATKKK